MYIGKFYRKVGDMEYTDISDGPIAGKGLARLIDRKTIEDLYGVSFKIISVDKLGYTLNNGSVKVSEWTIICQKR
jgi:hypothetical protein